MVLALQILHFKMWLWILTGLSIITKAHGYSSGDFPEACQSMSPKHSTFAAQSSEPPFEVTYQHGERGEPITVILQSKTAAAYFRGFMLEARVTGRVDESPPVGTFILLDSEATQLLTCSNPAGSAVSQTLNLKKYSIKVNWTAPGEELNITFRATFVQEFETFWESVDVDVTPPPTTTAPPTTTTSTAKPTNAPSTAKPSIAMLTTATSTMKSSIAMLTTATSTMKSSIAMLTTATSTMKSSIAMLTTATSTMKSSIAKPTTATSTTKSSIAMPTTATSTTNSNLAKPIPATSTTKQSTATPPPIIPELQRAGTALMAFDILFVVLKTAQAHIVTTTLTNSFRSRCLITVSKILCGLLCTAVEISSLMLFAVAQPMNVTLVALVCAVLLINFIEVVTDSISVGLSHELKEICSVVVKVCSVIHLIFATAVVFVGVLETVDCREKRNRRTESWLLKVMIAHTVWIFLFVIWVVVFSVHKHAMMGRSKTGSSRQNERWSEQREKRTLSAAAKIATAVSVILIVGTMSFTAAVIYGIFSGKRSCA